MKKFWDRYKLACPLWPLGFINPFMLLGTMFLFYVEEKINNLKVKL